MEFEQVKKSFWALDGAEVLTLLSSSENGLSDEEVKFLSLGIGTLTSALLFGLYW